MGMQHRLLVVRIHWTTASDMSLRLCCSHIISNLFLSFYIWLLLEVDRQLKVGLLLCLARAVLSCLGSA